MKSMVRYIDAANSNDEPVTITVRVWLRLRLPHRANSITRGMMMNRSNIFIVQFFYKRYNNVKIMIRAPLR